ncbi:MAG TPA: hypothetical protein VF593_03590 [Chthoniobacteraceae bacterium]
MDHHVLTTLQEPIAFEVERLLFIERLRATSAKVRQKQLDDPLPDWRHAPRLTAAFLD